MTDTPWTPAPLHAYGEHKSEHGEFVYITRESEPSGQIVGYPTPVGRYRNRADAQLGALAPEMAEAILASDEHECLEKCGKCIWCMQRKLRAIGEGND